MIFQVGDRIRAKEGVCPGSYGVVTGRGRGYASEDVLKVTYDNGRKDSIYGRMLELIEPASIDGYDMD